MITPNPLATFAQAELERRRLALIAAVKAGQIDQAAADANFNAWLAIACAIGARHPEFAVSCIWPEGATGRARPEDFAAPQIWRAELERARDHAIAKHMANREDAAALHRSIQMNQLANALGCAPIRPGAGGDYAKAA
jgi:hypothetical protein